MVSYAGHRQMKKSAYGCPWQSTLKINAIYGIIYIGLLYKNMLSSSNSRGEFCAGRRVGFHGSFKERHYADEAENAFTSYEAYDKYVLTNNDLVTWKELQQSTLSSVSGYIQHQEVYGEYV